MNRAVKTARNVKNTILNEDGVWKAQVVMMTENNSGLAFKYTRRFITSMVKGDRYVIKLITPKNIMASLLDKSTKVTKFKTIYKMANDYLDYRLSIPAELMALLIKDAILTLKDYDIALGQLPKSPKIDNYVEDHRRYGPNMYIILADFYDPYLIGELLKAGVPVAALLCISPVMTEEDDSLKQHNKDYFPFQSQQIESFWLFCGYLIENNPNTYKNVALIRFAPVYDFNLPHVEEMKIYDEISLLMYDIFDCYSQYQYYCRTANVIEYSAKDQDTSLFSKYARNLHRYPFECQTISMILDSIVEAISGDTSRRNFKVHEISISKTDMRRDISSSAGQSVKYAEPQSLTTSVFAYGNRAHAMSHFFKCPNVQYSLIEGLLRMPILSLFGTKIDENSKVLILHQMNQLRLCYGNDLILLESVRRFLHMCTCLKLFDLMSNGGEKDFPITSGGNQRFRSYLRCPEVEPLFLDGDGDCSNCSTPSIRELKETQMIPAHDDAGLFENVDLSQLFSYDDPERIRMNRSARKLENYNTFEELERDAMVQTLRDAASSFDDVLYRRLHATDSFVFLFYNKCDLSRGHRSRWKVRLPTPVGFGRFYYDFIRGRRDWVFQNESDLSSMIPDSNRSTGGRNKRHEEYLNKMKNITKAKTIKECIFNVGQSTVELSGYSDTFRSTDGTKVVVSREKFNADLKNWLTIQVSINKHRITVHKEMIDKKHASKLYFRISTEDGMELVCFDDRQVVNSIPRYLKTSISLPNGLCITTAGDYKDSLPAYIKQWYASPLSSSCQFSKEKYRLVSRKGDVFVGFTDGSVSVLQANGVRFVCHKFNASESLIKITGYRNIDIGGDCKEFADDVFVGELGNLRTDIAIDSKYGEVVMKRQDGTVMYLNKSGVQITRYADGTKIACIMALAKEEVFVEYGDETSQPSPEVPFVVVVLITTVEHPLYARIVLDNWKNTIAIDIPNGCTLKLEAGGEQSLTIDEKTKVGIEGLRLIAEYSSCLKCLAKTNVEIVYEHIMSTNFEQTKGDLTEKANYFKDYSTLLKMSDSFGKSFLVNSRGEVENYQFPNFSRHCNENETSGKNDCNAFKSASQTTRFFSLNRDLSGEEYHHDMEYDKFSQVTNTRTWSHLIQKNAQSDKLKVYSQALRPVVDIRKKGLMNSSAYPIKPKRLSRCDLRPLLGGCWMDMWPGVVKGYIFDKTCSSSLLRKPEALELRTLQKYVKVDWEKWTRLAVAKYREHAKSDFKDFIRLPYIYVDKKPKFTGEGKQIPGKSIEYIKSLEEESMEKDLPPSRRHYLHRRHKDFLDENYFRSILKYKAVIPAFDNIDQEPITPEVAAGGAVRRDESPVDSLGRESGSFGGRRAGADVFCRK